jgi:hypothetical protein
VLFHDRAKILDVISPRDRNAGIGFGSSAAALIVEKEVVFFAEVEQLREKIAVICSRSAV